jgi:L-rhamnose mutarotase
MCSRPVARVDGLIACDRLYHRNCLRCSHEGCGELLGDKYFEHGDKPYCRAHYLELAAERCAKCGLVVDGGLHALGRAWHPECLRCAQTDEPLEPGSAFMHEGRLVGPTARLKSAPRCHACNEPAVKDRLFAEGKIYHKDCFKCVHCRTVIGERKYVNFDGEPYLEGCYQKLFGSSAGEQKRTQVHGSLVRHVVTVPLLLSLGATGLTTFIKKHEEMLPAVRRLLRESGVQQFSTFVFLPPAISKPNMVISMQLPWAMDAETAFPAMLSDQKVGQQWVQLLDSVHDTGASRGNPWYLSITRELGPSTSSTGEVEYESPTKPLRRAASFKENA